MSIRMDDEASHLASYRGKYARVSAGAKTTHSAANLAPLPSQDSFLNRATGSVFVCVCVCACVCVCVCVSPPVSLR